MPTTFGEKTLNIVYKKEAQKLHEAFQVASGETIHEGELVKLNTNGEIVPAATGNQLEVIGFCITHKKEFNAPVSVVEELSVAMRGYATVKGSAKEDGLTPGPVMYAGWDAANNRPMFSFNSVDETNIIGWALEAGDMYDEIRVVIKD